MKKKRSGDSYIFRELTGLEFKVILLESVVNEFRAALEKELDGTNQFNIGNSYPFVRVTGSLEVKIIPNEHLPAPFPIYIKMELGRTVDTSPDRMRELYGLQVLQPEKQSSGLVVNVPVKEGGGDG